VLREVATDTTVDMVQSLTEAILIVPPSGPAPMPG
jgi:hypothetical protein